MRLKAFLLLMVLVGCIGETLSQKSRKFKKAYAEDKKYWSLQEKLERLQEEEAELEKELEEELEGEIDSEAGNVNDIIDFPSLVGSTFDEEDEEEEKLEDPCKEKHCGAGRECIILGEKEATCQCVEECEDIEDDRRKVCSNYNSTWPSDCELYKMRCLCTEGSTKCTNSKFEHLHIDYYGECQDVPKCKDEEMVDFPRRMREWLFNIMRDMAERKELSEHYLEMEKAVEIDEGKKAANAAIWKWCELDGHPKDRSVSRHELFPLRAPLYTLEHCISPFLDSCDPNDDHVISLKEWTDCLHLTQDLSENIDDLCDEIRD